MASSFNLTAQINLRGPANIKTVVADIRRQLGTINADINLKVNPQAARSIDTVRTRLDAMNNALLQARQNTDQLNTALQNLSASLGNIQNISGRTTSAVNGTSASARSVAKNIKTATTEMEEFGKQSALAVRRFAAFSVVTSGIFSLINAVNDGFRAFVEFDKELIRLQQVTGRGALGLKSLEKEITNLAVSLGVSSTSLTTVATTLAQAGLSAEETRVALAALAKTALAPSFDNLVDTTEGAIAAIRQFGLEAGQLESALGSINAVAAAFAVESGDIISAIQRTGGVFAAASKGVSEGTDSLNEFIAIFTSVRQTTRESAETIATGLRTIFTRLQRAQTIDQLRDFGVELTDLEGKFVGPFEAVKRLSAALSQLDPRDLRFSKIVEELGGFRQIGKVIPLIQQFAVAQTALKVAQQGQSSLVDAQIAAQKSLANQLTKVREQFLALIRDIGQSQTFQNLFKIVTGLTSGLISLIGAFKPILPILAIFGLAKGVKAATQFGAGFLGNLKKGGGAQAVGETAGNAITGQKQREAAETTSLASKNIAENTGAVRILTDAMNNLYNRIGDVSSAITNSVDALSRIVIDNRGSGGNTLNGGGVVRKFARGGFVPGSGDTDSVPAMLQPGEFVLRKKAAAVIGSDELHRMNKYATGGPVKASDLPSAALKKRVKRANSKEAQNNPELFKQGYYLTDSDLITFEKNEYGLSANPNIQALKFEEKVKDRVGGQRASSGIAPVDILGSRLGNLEVRNRIRTTKDRVLLDKFLRQRLEENKPLISNTQYKDQLKFDDPIGVVYNTGKIQRSRFKQLYSGGLIQPFVNGGTVEQIAASKGIGIQQAILEQLQALGGGAGVKQILGSVAGSALARKALRKDSIEAGRYLKESSEFINQALAKKGVNDAVEQSRVSKLQKVAVAGLLPIGYKKDFEWDIGNSRSVYASVRGFSDRYKDAVYQMQQETASAASRFAENLQYSDIFSGGEKLVFDFDETLVAGADILGPDGKPDIAKYSDRKEVSEALKRGRLTRLGTKVKQLVSSNPDFLKNTRILTARPQQTTDLLASALQSLGLPYQASDITGVGQDSGSTAAKKAANLQIIEKLVDDNLDNISISAKAGKKGFLYNEPKSMPGLDEIIGQGNIEGAVIEKALALLGANLPPIEQLESNRAIDFPGGLGRAAQFFGLDPNIPTEVKRTLDGSSFERARAEFARYFSENKFASGGSVEDTVPALLTPGEFVINKKAAQKIGYSKLYRMNKADKRQGFNKGGLVGDIQKFAAGGRTEEDAFIEYKARQANMGDRQYRVNLAAKVADAEVSMGRDFRGRQEEFRYGLVNDQSRLKGIDTSTDVGKNQLDQAITEIANRIQAFDPTLDFDKAKEAARELADGLINTDVNGIQDAYDSAEKLKDIFDDLGDSTKRAEKARAAVAKSENIDINILKNQVSNKEVDRQRFIRSPEGQKFGRLAEVAPDFAQKLSGSKLGGVLGSGADFISGRGGRLSKLFAGAGGFTGIGAGVAVAADQAKQFLPTSLKSNATAAGVLGAVGGAGSGAASGAMLGSQIAGPVGALIGGIGGAIIGGIDGWFAGKNQQVLANSLDQITKSSSDLDMAFKKLDQNASKVNLDNAQKAFGKVLEDTNQLNAVAFGEKTTVGSMAGSGALGVAGGAVAGAALGSVVPILGTALGAAAGAVLGGIAGAYVDYRSRPTEAERTEALQTRIGMSTQNQQSATRLFQADLSNMSTAGIDKLIKSIQDGTARLNPLAETYAKSAIASASATRQLTQAEIEQIRITAEEDAVLDAFSAAMKQAGMENGKVTELIKKDRAAAIAKGKELEKEQSLLAAKSVLLARVTRDVAVATEQTIDIYRRAIAGVQRYGQELEAFQANSLNRSGDLTGKARAGRVDRTNERILGNISAFSIDEVRKAARQAGGIAGGGANSNKLERDAISAKILRDELPKAIKSVGPGGTSADIISILEGSFNNAGIVFSDELKQQIKDGIDKKTISSDQNVALRDLLDPAIIDELLKGPEEALRFAAELQSKYNDTLDTANSLLQEFNELTNEAAEWQRKAAQIRYSAEIELARALGNSPTLAQLNKPIDQNIRSITAQNGLIPGGSADPQAIFNAMQRGRANADIIQSNIDRTRSQIGLPAANNDALNQSIEQQTKALNKQKAALNDGNRALKQLAEDGSKAANALSKIQDRRQQAQAVSDLSRRVLTSDNDELNQLNKGLSAYTKTISGRASSGDIANLDFRRQAFEGLDSISSILPAGVAQKMQARLSRTMLESTANGRATLDRVITKDADGGNRMTLRDALNNAESGIDPQQQKYIDAYREATAVQARAAELLAQNALLAAEQLNMDIKSLFEGIETKLGQILDRAVGEAGARQAENKPKGGGAFNVTDDPGKPLQKPAPDNATQPWTPFDGTPDPSRPAQTSPARPLERSAQTSPARPLNWSAANIPSDNDPSLRDPKTRAYQWDVLHVGGRPAAQNAQSQLVDHTTGLPVSAPGQTRTASSNMNRPVMSSAPTVTQKPLSPYEQMMKNRRDAYDTMMEGRRNDYRQRRGLPPATNPRQSSPVPTTVVTSQRNVATTSTAATTQSNNVQQSSSASGAVAIDENSRQFMEAFSTTLRGFGSYVDKLAEIKLPEKIELTGTHIVDVRITGAAALEQLDKNMRDLAMAIIEPKIAELRNEVSAVTRGAVKNSASLGNKP